ncbi:zinc finger ZAT9-like [Olea europaea subsp. europaea]|uniref:Zinc finger ZAT9-like n=1 Tax=Olea europaea subsp. europaea TaxID=158383 RepID=A0A8S0QMZ0_OLEEU|nr:zinc finger ZAT9-like [Olea europaea subsp. europaea]
MEKYRCKLCFRNFANGKALGGHMRSHMMNFYAAKKEKKVQTHEKDSQSSDDFQLSSSTSEEENGEKEVSCYGLRENPKKSIRFVDPRFFCASSSVVLQDRESETESIPNPIFRRCKRIRKTRISVKETEMMKSKFEKGENTSNEFSDEPLSSISDTPEEDVAYCLMMLSRDTWQREQNEEKEEEDRERNKYEDDEYSEDSGAVMVAKSTKFGGKYRCETCNKVFRSYQALGGHRANHKKIKANIKAETPPRMVVETGKNGGSIQVEEKIHECPICFRVFSSGQALGGHKRSHFTGGGAISANVNSINTPPPAAAKPFSRIGETLNIDLNLPAPVEDDDEISQLEYFA